MSEAEENAIIVDNVYKNFNVYYDKTNTIKEKVLFWNKSKKEVREILKGINLKIKKGEVVGLIGVNGSGKSTLLKLMTKIIYPNKGRIITNGKLTSLLDMENIENGLEALTSGGDITSSSELQEAKENYLEQIC